jgi:uncharacterized membrane protein
MMKKHLKTLLFCMSLLTVSTNAQAATMPLSKTDTVTHKQRVRLWTDPTYPPVDATVRDMFLIGSSFAVVGLAIIAYSIHFGTGDLGTALLAVASILSGLTILVVTGFIWLERFMKSVNRRRKKDGKSELSWVGIRVIQILLAAALLFASTK